MSQRSIAHPCKDHPDNFMQVARDAEALLLQLLGMVKQSALVTLPGSVAIVVIKAVGSIAAQRPQYLGRVLPTLLSAASASSANDTVRLFPKKYEC